MKMKQLLSTAIAVLALGFTTSCEKLLEDEIYGTWQYYSIQDQNGNKITPENIRIDFSKNGTLGVTAGGKSFNDNYTYTVVDDDLAIHKKFSIEGVKLPTNKSKYRFHWGSKDTLVITDMDKVVYKMIR